MCKVNPRIFKIVGLLFTVLHSVYLNYNYSQVSSFASVVISITLLDKPEPILADKPLLDVMIFFGFVVFLSTILGYIDRKSVV